MSCEHKLTNLVFKKQREYCKNNNVLPFSFLSYQDLARSGRILANFGEFLPAKSREIDERTTKSICLVPQSTSSNKTFIFFSQVCDFFILISHKLKTQKRKEKYLDYTVTQIYRIQEKNKFNAELLSRLCFRTSC